MSNCDCTPSNCPTSFCHEGLRALPESVRLNLVGTQTGGKCLHRLPRSAQGFVTGDGDGQLITNQPRVHLPIRNSLILDESGRPIVSSSGAYTENPPPKFDLLIGRMNDGEWWSIKGQNGIRQKLQWNGCKFEFVSDEIQSLEDYPSVAGPEVKQTYELVAFEVGGEVKTGIRVRQSRMAGECIIWPSDVIPTGWLLCDGSEYDINEYSELFTVIGYNYGQGSGTNFRVPDPRGMFLRFTDNGAGRDNYASSRTENNSGGNIGDAVGSEERIEVTEATDRRLWNLGFNLIIFTGRSV